MVGQNPKPKGKRVRHAAALGWLPAIFIISAPILMLFWILLLATYVVHRTYVGGDGGAAGGRLEAIWSWLVFVGIAWTLVNLYWAVRSLRLRSEKGYLGHWTIALGCGLCVVGIQAVILARGSTLQPLVLDVASPTATVASRSVPADVAPAAIAGDPDQGKQIFATSCLTCHGPTGQGMPGLAPSLVGSPFIDAADDSAIASVIRLGRAVGDPNNKSGKVMPARGGNPFLTEEQIAHLTAFVRAIQSGTVGAEVGADEAAVQLARWVVPAAVAPPAGLDLQKADAEINAGMARVEQLAERRVRLLRSLTMGLVALHGLFLTGVLVLSSNLVIARILFGDFRLNPFLARLSVGGWVLVAIAWLLIAWLCFWWS